MPAPAPKVDNKKEWGVIPLVIIWAVFLWKIFSLFTEPVPHETDVQRLTKFLVVAKIQNNLPAMKEAIPQRPGFREFEFIQGDFNYRDSQTGFYKLAGQEVVRFREKPFWVMSYQGRMADKYEGSLEFTGKTIVFLKEALTKIQLQKPMRGPDNYRKDDFEYRNSVEGNVARFRGTDRVLYKGEEVFTGDYTGGLIADK